MINFIIEILHVLLIIISIHVIMFITTDYKLNMKIDKEIKHLKESKEHILNYQEIINLKNQKQKGSFKRALVIILFLLFYFAFVFTPSVWFLLYYIPLKILFYVYIYKKFIRWYYGE